MASKELDDAAAKKQIDQMCAFILQEAKEKASEIAIKVICSMIPQSWLPRI